MVGRYQNSIEILRSTRNWINNFPEPIREQISNVLYFVAKTSLEAARKMREIPDREVLEKAIKKSLEICKSIYCANKELHLPNTDSDQVLIEGSSSDLETDKTSLDEILKIYF